MATHGAGINANYMATGRHYCRKRTKEKHSVQGDAPAHRISRTPLKKIRRKTPWFKNTVDMLIQWGIALHDIDIFTIVIVLCQSFAVVAGIYTTLSPASSINKSSEEDEWNVTSNLVVCLPEDSTSCVKYVNSTKNGLIALNESVYPALKAFKEDFDYRLIARINPFWLKFEPPTDTYYNTMATLYMFIFLVGTSGNGLVIYMFARCKALRTSPYMLVLNLAISDFLIVFKCPLAALNNYMREPVLGDWGCRVYGFIGGLSGTASIGMLTIIALDRYSVVVDPLNPNRVNSRYYALWILFVWMYALFFSSMPLAEIGLSRYVPEGYFTTCSFDYLDTSTEARVFMFVFFLCAWLVPLSVICFCYFHILNVVFTARECIQSNKGKQNIEVRLAIVVLLIILLWFLAWTPYSIVAICGIFEHEEYLTPSRAMIPALFCKSASCLNPFLYTISHKRFRHELQRLFCNRKPIIHYSTTRSSYVNKSSRRQRQVDITKDTPAPSLGRTSARRHENIASFYHQRQYMVKRNVRCGSTPDGAANTGNNSGQYIRATNRSSMVAERGMGQYDGCRASTSRKSVIAGPEGSGLFVIDARPSVAPEDDVIFIVSGRRSSMRQSISTQVFVISSDNDDAAKNRGPLPPTHLETSF